MSGSHPAELKAAPHVAVSAPSELAYVALHITLKLMQHTRSTSAARHTSFVQETREVMRDKSGCVGKATIQFTFSQAGFRFEIGSLERYYKWNALSLLLLRRRLKENSLSGKLTLPFLRWSHT